MKKHLMVCGFHRCVFEERLTQCFACFGFGHLAAQFNRTPHCGKCSSNDHQTEECTEQVLKCCNCSEKKVRADPGNQHGAFMTWLCPVATSFMSGEAGLIKAGKNGNRAQVA